MTDRFYLFRNSLNPKQSYWVKAPPDENELAEIAADAAKLLPKIVDPEIEADAKRIKERLQPTTDEIDELLETDT